VITIIRDRGNIKWTAMMLPEHVAMLRELKASQNNKQKPIIDEQQFEEMNEVIRLAIEGKETVLITYFKEYDHKSIVGEVRNLDEVFRCIRIFNGEKSLTLNVENIIDIKIVVE
jgi:hypothetical protein